MRLLLLLSVGLILSVATAASIGCSSTTSRLGLPELETVEQVDLDRYLGEWYEVASFPMYFQRGCVASKATYTKREDGLIGVRNECRDGCFDGPERSVEGRAKVVEGSGGAKLKVSFFWFFWGDYWIIDLDADYQHAVVGHPSRDYLWILSRQPEMPEATYEAILERIAAKGYETDRLVRTKHPVPIKTTE